MVALILILLFSAIVLAVTTYFVRKGKKEEIHIIVNKPTLCCGAHEICEMDNLQIVDTQIEYFDDEELDELAGLSSDEYSKQQLETFSEIFYSMQESDVASWLRSLQLRKIELPANIREEALMIVCERRENARK